MTRAVSLAQMGSNNTTYRNRLINGGMVIDQRNAGASVTITNTSGTTYTVDRWGAYGTQASKFSVQQNAGSVTPPAGFKNYLGVTSASAYSVGTNDYFFLTQPIEGYNIADLGFGTVTPSTFTISFWVRSSLTGTFGGSIINNAYNRSYPFTYTINSTSTWEQKSITITADTTGTWESTSNAGLRLQIGLGAGSAKSGAAGSWAATEYETATGATSVVGTSGATFYITGVQLEVGTTATPFEYRQYGTELALCQRYYQKCSTPDSVTAFCTGVFAGANTGWFTYAYKVSMRAAPTMNGTASGFTMYTLTAGANSTNVSLNSYQPTTEYTWFRGVGTGGSGSGGGYGTTFSGNSASSYVDFSAEL